MGMYTELYLSVELSAETPSEVVDTLRFMCGEFDEQTCDSPSHRFFTLVRWKHILRMSSHYFTPFSTFVTRYNDISKAWFLDGRSSLKNYEGEIEAFLDWIAPHVATVGHGGHYRYEENLHPTLIYFGEGSSRFCLRKVR